MTRLVLTSEPAVEPLTVAEVRERCGITTTEMSNDTVSALITSARQQLDGWAGMLGRCLITQTWTLYVDEFDDCGIEIPLPPLQSIASVKYIDGDGAEQTVDASVYRIIPGTPSLLELAYGESWPSHREQDDAVRVEFVAGYGDTGSSVPEPIRQAICLQVSHLRSLTKQNLFLKVDEIPGVRRREWTVSDQAGMAIDTAVNRLVQAYRIPVL